jgi:hypothetical protein
MSRDPVEALIQSHRPTRGRIERVFSKLNTDAGDARNPGQLDNYAGKNERLYRRLEQTNHAQLAEDWYKRVSETIRKRSDKLRVTGSTVKVAVQGGLRGVGNAGVLVEKGTTKAPPPE